jgi:peptidoglycan-associated lipoprotein
MRATGRHLILGLFGVALAFTVSCSSNKAKDDKDKAAAGAGEEKASISSEAMSFNPAGSDSGTVEGLSTIHFKLDSSTLDESNRKTLSDNAGWMKAHKNLTVQIEGHCDARGSVEYNLALGERRAKAVKEYLVNLGVDTKHLTIISYGKEKPIATGDNEDAYEKNRRANFVPLQN